MLADLFNDPRSENTSNRTYSTSRFQDIAPPSKRSKYSLCGIINQGATCYLNTLLQTLFFTREFRENLFSLTGEELGVLPSKNGQQSKLRIIPVELQRLFGGLLMLDQEACSTNKLTDSFGWTNNEELQQHDVQELNRILFSAIEQSLVNTKQSKLIQELYRGTSINKIKCLTCLNVAEREEEFLDLAITVQGSPNLNFSLSNSFIDRENLNGNNQYKCEKCNNQYRDAEKYCQLKSLPPILTLSLLRFTYDLRTFQRIKETGRFEFPLELDLKEYMEDSIKTKLNPEYTQYELFSIIIHSGSAYGGHYHCYIRDFDNIGNWILSEQVNLNPVESESKNLEQESEPKISDPKEIILIYCDEDEDDKNNNKTDLVNLDYLKYDKPLELLKAFIYNKNKYEEFKVENVCADLSKVTGVSWNKRFRNKYGPIEKFLRKHDETFELSQDGKYVKLKPHDRINIMSARAHNSNELIEMCLKEVDENIKEPTPDKELKLSEEDLKELDAKYHWYDFDDSRITPIFSSKIKQQFEGKESAYMLFYHRKTKHSKQDLKQFDKRLPKWLIEELNNENLKLKQKRDEYEASLNKFKVEFHLESDFYIEKNILNLKPEFQDKKFLLTIDKKNTLVNDLQEILVNYCTDQQQEKESSIGQQRKETCLELLFDERPTYWFLIQRVDTSLSGRYNYFAKSILEEPNQNLYNQISSNLILVLCKHSDLWPIGDDFEPIRIVLRYFDKKFEIKEISYTFTKSTQINHIKNEFSSFLINEQTNYELGLTDEELNALLIQTYTFNLITSKPTSIISKEDAQKEKILLDSSLDEKTLKDLCVKNGDIVTVESESNIDELFDKKLTIQDTKASKVYSNRTHKITIMNCLFNKQRVNLGINELLVEESDSIKNIRVMALSSFDIDSVENSHLRFLSDENSNENEIYMANLLSTFSMNDYDEDSINSISYPVPCLHDDAVLGEILEPVLKNNLEEEKLVFIICHGRAPLKSNNEIVIKCYREDDKENYKEILIDLNRTRVKELTDEIIKKMNLKQIEVKNEECYYLKKLDWFGDVESILNNFNSLCADANLKHNQTLVITRGKMIPPNHLKLNTWISFDNLITKNETNETDDNVVLNHFMDSKYKNYKFLDEYIISNETKLEDLKVIIQSSLMNRQDVKPWKNIRLRLLNKLSTGDFLLDSIEIKFQMKKSLIDWHKPLKQFHFKQEANIGIELLEDEEDNLNQGIMLLDCIKFELKTKLCSKKSFKQIQWNINNGASLNSLKESILKAFTDEIDSSDLFRIQIAKRLTGKYQWILLKDQTQAQNDNQSSVKSNKKKKKSSNPQQAQNKSNLKQAPFYLDDGDLIAFTIPETNQQATAQDFMSTEDLEFLNKKNITTAELNRIRKEKKFNSDEDVQKRNKFRQEIGIKIKIDDFS